MVQAICSVAERGRILSLRRNIRLTGQKESAVTKEQIDTLLKSLDKAGVGTNGGGTANKLQSMQGDALLVLAISFPLHLHPR